MPDYNPETGEPVENKKRPLADMLGTAYCEDLNQNVKKATWEDLLAAYGYIPPGGRRRKNPINLSPADLTNLKEAMLEKSGWTYNGPAGSACCSCTI